MAFAVVAMGVGAAEPAGADFFEKKIRPVLVEHCYECHGEKKQKGGLRLDGAAATMTGGDSGPALVPGEPARSLLIKAVSWSDPELQMPPKNQLTGAQIAALTDWVKMGAPDPRTNLPVASRHQSAGRTNHWAYQPILDSPVPQPAATNWPRADIDRFVLSALEKRGLKPAADAGRRTLLRRAYFDLTGLPPTPEQMQAFLNDPAPDAFARLVDQLLASPAYGERWGRHWLDVARYGESVTLRGFVFKQAWRYRDYVIGAFNGDLPYDQFIREQIAGDMLESPDLEERQRRLTATTFLALGNTNFEEQDKAQLRMDIVDEQLDTIGKAFLAQTLGCARCHDHKFDPIPTRDYYAMAGILRSTRTVTNANVSGWLEVPLPLPAEQEKVFQKHEAEVAAARRELARAREVAKGLAGQTSEPRSLRGFQPTVVAVADLPGLVVDSAQARAVGEWKHSRITKHYVGDGYLHDDARGKGEKTLTFIPELKKPGRYEVRFAYTHSPSRATNVPVTIFHADGETTVRVNEQEAPVLDGRFVALGQFRFEGNGFGSALVSTEGTTGYVTVDAVQFLPLEMVETTTGSGPGAKEIPPARGELKALEAKLKRIEESGPRRPMVMTVIEEPEPADTFVHVRGSVHNLGPKVPRGVLQVAVPGAMTAIPPRQSGRRELAGWLASRENPLPARVMVNRVWHWLFGAGLVRTVDNFGTTGEVPSHPELLDHLAARFIAEGWSVKKLVREIMLSRTYQLDSTVDGLALPPDPENRLLARANRRRLDAECLRDAMLAAGGRLSQERGGPTFKAGQSSDYGFQFAGLQRSVYVPAFRNALPEIFEAFDFADPSMVVGARNVSTVAPQALYLMNHPFVREQARAIAGRLLAEKLPDDRARLAYACELLLGRPPTAGEQSVAGAALGGADALTGWTDVVHALLASPDFRYVN